MLDTNMCIFLLKHRTEVLEAFQDHRADGICISAIVLAELEFGIENSAQRDKNRMTLLSFLPLVEILPFDAYASGEYSKICADLKRRGTPIGQMDMLIAAHARSQSLTLVTNNTREFERVENLNITDWTVQ